MSCSGKKKNLISDIKYIQMTIKTIDRFSVGTTEYPLVKQKVYFSVSDVKKRLIFV